PGRQMSCQGFYVQGLQLDLRKAEGNRRTAIGSDTLVGKFLEEGYIAITVNRIDHCHITTSTKAFDFADDSLIVLVMEGGILLLNISFLHPLFLQIESEDFIGGAWVYIVRADQVKTLLVATLRTHQIIHGWRGLLIDRGPGVDHVFGAFLTLIL